MSTNGTNPTTTPNLDLVLDLARARTLVLRDVDQPLGGHHGLGLNDLAVLLELKSAPASDPAARRARPPARGDDLRDRAAARAARADRSRHPRVESERCPACARRADAPRCRGRRGGQRRLRTKPPALRSAGSGRRRSGPRWHRSSAAPRPTSASLGGRESTACPRQNVLEVRRVAESLRSAAEPHDGRPVGRVRHLLLDERMLRELVPNGLAHRAGAAAVDHAHLRAARPATPRR